MKVMVKSVTRSKGISRKKSAIGTDYDICTVNCLSPLEPRSWANDNGEGALSGHGVQDYELPLDISALDTFKNFPFPCEIELITADRVMFGRMTQVVTGCVQAK